MLRTLPPASSFICVKENPSENNHLLLSEIIKGRVNYLRSVAFKVIFAVIRTAPSLDSGSEPQPSNPFNRRTRLFCKLHDSKAKMIT